MKKRIFALALAVMMVISAVSVSAAAVNHQPNADKATYTVTYDGLTPGAMYGMLVLSGTDDNFTVNEDNILYIDQATADADGKITFTEFALKGAAPSEDSFIPSSVYIGGGNLTSAEWVGILEKLLAFIFGDITGDGKVNKQDLLRLAKYFAGWDVEITDGASDVTGDGKVNKQDLLRLAKYFAGWDVALGSK